MTDSQHPAPQPPPRKRRRSAYISTLLVGSAAAVMLAACGDDAPQQTEAKIFPSVQACETEFSVEECNAAFEQSRQLHQQNAPRFNDMNSCEAQMGAGACQSTVVAQPDGSVSNVFVPALMGFMLARALQPQSNYGYIGGGSRGYYYPRPVYVDRDGYMRSGNADIGRWSGGSRDSFSRSSVPTTVSTTVSKSGQVGTPSRTTTRGGFGKSSSSFSGSGFSGGG
ncbi:DUF1190 domain-containing protein [Niveispirillum sp. SYP-B3756]|uniref:DUF1190 domain-containing protein n=1 Tax=Niveispirillum sp. SYP-B3756 TaxID=2662178 RepID=UPI001290AD99|nr:DUF1190 domain-containing protein [Niveispirillum sp. SYP-B3756]MQP64401.1 DUF1190 domain-containing protein [Niveispirillum sp. SYP-B3756]